MNFLALSQEPETFDAAAFVAPFTGLGSDIKRQLSMIKPVAKVIGYFAPTHRFAIAKPKNQPWMDHWYNDPKAEAYKVDANFLVETFEIGELMQNEVIHNITTPFLIILGGKDTAIDNDSAKLFHEKAPATVKELIEHDEADHGILQDKEFSSDVINAMV